VEVSGAVIDQPGDGRAAPATVLDPVAETGGSNGSSGSTAGAQQLVGPGSRTESR
jgi:hypothetical protein